MDKKVVKTVKTVTTIYYTVQEIEEILLKHSGMSNGSLKWDEYSGGGIRGCDIVLTSETNEE